ncbi:MAG: hypothetical protein DCF25_08500 [Leptolyngbya foveolarum]|uniref:Transcription factor RcaD n=1 Tax=Leptolyngbya foveolarum TaxID=47253 RepID=A0A2W4WJH0_9CYAN|nr:MAG: hypothetical protein DCF25_08500 [Leptolyngbya foveolarum]
MASLKAIELKFLLELVNFDDYRSKITKIKPSSKTPASERNKACKELLSKGFVENSQEILKFVTAGPGKDLLSKDSDSLPVQLDPKELVALEVGAKESSPGQLGKKVPAEERQVLLRNLAERGLIKASKTAINEVWLSAQGKQFLREEYVAIGSWTITAAKLGNYVKFLRESASQAPGQRLSPNLPTGQPHGQRPLSQPGSQLNSAMPIGSQTKPDAGAVLQQIKQLDQLIGTDNYLPIYHLREKLQPPLTREELDSRLYELQRSDRIELSSLHDKGDYNDRQISAGIAQNHGRSLFFIAVL